MNILLIGSGGREHAIARKLSQSSKLSKLFIAPGNPGTAKYGKNIPINEADQEDLLRFAKEHQINLTIVGPEAPLAAGIADKFRAQNLDIIGPNQAAAQLESSKSWAKDFMARHNIPTASYAVLNNYEDATTYLRSENSYPIVIKADGLAAGKGVTVAHSESEADIALKDIFIDQKFAEAGTRVVIESFLEGEEASILSFCDGKTIIPMESAQDHKPAYDEDKGPNTGGMGAYSPAPIVTPEVSEKVKTQIFDRLLAGFNSEKIPVQGIIYAGLMINASGDPYVVEFNMRFGDPETQAVLARLDTDLIEIFESMSHQTLDTIKLNWKKDPSICVVMASKGYPGRYEKGKSITGIKAAEMDPDIHVIEAGTKEENGLLKTNGGRVLGVVGSHSSLEAAITKTYEAVAKINFDGAHYRTDIAKKAKSIK